MTAENRIRLDTEEELPSEIFWELQRAGQATFCTASAPPASTLVPRGLTAPLAEIFDVANPMRACGRDIPGKRLKLRQRPCHRLAPDKMQALIEQGATNPTIPRLPSLTPMAKDNRPRYGNRAVVIPKSSPLTCLEKAVLRNPLRG